MSIVKIRTRNNVNVFEYPSCECEYPSEKWFIRLWQTTGVVVDFINFQCYVSTKVMHKLMSSV